MVDDNEVGPFSSSACPGDKTALKKGTTGSQPSIGAGAQPCSRLAAQGYIELCQISGDGFSHPLLGALDAVTKKSGRRKGIAELSPAEVVANPFEYAVVDLFAEHVGEQGQVVASQLIL